MKTLIIRSTVIDEIEQVLKIQDQTNLSSWSKTDYENELIRNDSIFKVAVSEKKEIIGFAVVRLLLDSEAKSFDSAELLNIAVEKSQQKKGIGQEIFGNILFEIKLKEISEIWLEVRHSNTQAINFYKKNGFIKQSIRKDYYNNPIENAFIFKLLLS